MDPAALTSATRALQQRVRFEAVRRRVFGELEQGSARWRLTWLLPFQVFVVGLLIARGESCARAALQIAMVAVIAVHFVLRTFTAHKALKVSSFVSGLTSYFVLIATTGGLASPLLIMGALMMTAAAFMVEPRGVRPTVYVGFLLGFGVLALCGKLGVGLLEAPLTGPNGPTVEYFTIALLGMIFVMMGVYRMGCTMTRGYERAALELATRREELCSEGADRSRALEGMAARLAHEVKNPLAAIKGLSTHVARSTNDAKTAERLAIVAAEADRLQGIVDGFLSFSRGLDDLTSEPTVLHEVLRELGVLLETRAEDAGISLSVSGDEQLMVDADPRKLRQALLNLVLNAIQASPRGASVKLAVTGTCSGARITVQDDGVGMTPEVLERIRKPYFTTKEGGTGLGVAVARGIVEQHGGSMEIQSASGKGTTVTIVLPSKAKACMRLPNPLRAERAEKPEPVAAGAR